MIYASLTLSPSSKPRAKALHPDLNTHLAPAQAQEAFLRLVAAYEVLSDEQQRRLYDASTDPALPRVLRRAAAAQQQQAADAAAGSTQGAQTAQDAGLNWRWGLAEWARYGPAASPDPLASAAGGAWGAGSGSSADINSSSSSSSSLSGMHLSALSALRRHQRELELELHAALMTAFLGPTLKTRPGELPTTFECDERSHPALTDDLLHLVHGRTLLGVVTTPTTLRLEGATQEVLQIPHSSSGGIPPASTHSTAGSNAHCQPAPGPAATAIPETKPSSATPQQPHTQGHKLGTATPAKQQQSGELPELSSDDAVLNKALGGMWSQVLDVDVMQDDCSGTVIVLRQSLATGGVQGHAADLDPSSAGTTTAAGGATAAAAAQGTAAAAAAEETSADPDAEISHEQWRELLQRQHPLLGQYDWRGMPSAAAAGSSSDTTAPAEWQQTDAAAWSAADAAVAAAGGGSVQDSASAFSATATDKSSSVSDTGVNMQQQQQQQRQQQDPAQQQQAGDAAICGVDASDSSHGVAPATLGGRAAREAYMHAVSGLEGAPGAGVNPDQQLGTLGTAFDSSSCPEPLASDSANSAGGVGCQQQQQGAAESWQQQWHRLDPAAQLHMQQQWYQQWQEQQEQRNHPAAVSHGSHPKQQQSCHHHRQQGLELEHQQQHLEGQMHYQQQQGQTHHQHHHKQQQQQQPVQERQQSQQHQQQRKQHQHKAGGHPTPPRRPRSGHRRLWRWLRDPSADWLAADWSFTDEREGVMVLQLIQEGGLAAVGVRDELQDLKPMKVYVDGVLLAAVLDDVVLQPLTGKLLAVMYKFYTPGVHHVYFMLPNTPGASRIMARLRRRWLPPSATWLFPPRVDSHDRCSWVLEWEGFNTQHRPGWLHPAVYVMTAAYLSFDLEQKRLQRRKEGRGSVQLWLRQLGDHSVDMFSQAQAFCRLLVDRLRSSRSS